VVRRPPRALTTGVPAGIAIAGLAIAGHGSAGGEVSGISPLIAVAICVLGAVSLRTSIRWTFSRLLVAATAVQPVLHLVMSGESGHAHHGAGASAGTGDPPMWLMHGGLAIVAAVTIRWGVRWLRSMPAVARALLPPRRARAGTLLIVVPIGPPTPVLACDRHSLLTWTNRGPPG
jgi:hypothetical protein